MKYLAIKTITTFAERMMNRTIFFRITFTLVLLLGATYMFAPPALPGGAPGCWPPPCIPIDGGIGLLLAAGAALGIKKGYDSYKCGKQAQA